MPVKKKTTSKQTDPEVTSASDELHTLAGPNFVDILKQLDDMSEIVDTVQNYNLVKLDHELRLAGLTEDERATVLQMFRTQLAILATNVTETKQEAGAIFSQLLTVLYRRSQKSSSPSNTSYDDMDLDELIQKLRATKIDSFDSQWAAYQLLE